ncbi:MAG: DUF4406 domain-containing protein [Ruminococcus sp.]|uniref:DUF7768 domain-containing protein n=1 Tax=Ruminococcus sp. TaxID=41978 RepID=UPI0025CEE592|nr:DUF4406 domain-containing protein [Ruminococcus sp.]MBR5682990.1 DUF4406 domain-containing protein [Ruminococcus sp.]
MNYRNSEGYASPTEYEALSRIQREERADKIKRKYRPFVYICSPFSLGDKEENIRNAKQYCKFAVENHAIPFAPHLLFPLFLNDDIPAERELALFMNRIILAKCDEIWIFGNIFSKGMQREIKLARRKKLNIRYFPEIVFNNYM